MNRIKELRTKKGITQDELGHILGVQKAAVSKYEKEHVQLPQEVLVALCDYFKVTADHLLGRDGMVETIFKGPKDISSNFMPVFDTVGVPLVGRVHAGMPMLADENITEYVPLPASEVSAGEYFYMEVEGDCMIGEFIPEGALVLVRQQANVENGCIAVARTDDEVLLRKVKFLGDSIMLIPANSKYEPIVMHRSEVEIVGRVTEVRIRGL